jgi:hypothetical protein
MSHSVIPDRTAHTAARAPTSTMQCAPHVPLVPVPETTPPPHLAQVPPPAPTAHTLAPANSAHIPQAQRNHATVERTGDERRDERVTESESEEMRCDAVVTFLDGDPPRSFLSERPDRGEPDREVRGRALAPYVRATL